MTGLKVRLFQDGKRLRVKIRLFMGAAEGGTRLKTELKMRRDNRDNSGIIFHISP